MYTDAALTAVSECIAKSRQEVCGGKCSMLLNY